MNDRFKFKYVYRGKVCRIFKLLFEANEIEEVYFKYPIGCTLCPRVAKYNPDNLLQCTGLKDKNGTLIYEGDIVKNEENSVGHVEWEDAIGQYYVVFSIDMDLDFYSRNYEVIGNKYENPELLKGQND